MKCIMYISQAATKIGAAGIPSGLTEIYRVAQKHNKENSVSGIFSFRRGHYIQVIEGDELRVNELYRKIKSDPRHRNITTLLDIRITERSFPNWNMKLVTSVNKEQSFVEFLGRFFTQFQSLSADKQTLLEYFYKVRQDISQINADESFNNTDVLRLNAWPDFTAFHYSPPTIELVARLIKREQIYVELIECGEFGNKEQIDRLLKRFNKSGLLSVNKGSDFSLPPKTTQNDNRFYSKMKNFLGMR